jgi:hypothetical protein
MKLGVLLLALVVAGCGQAPSPASPTDVKVAAGSPGASPAALTWDVPWSDQPPPAPYDPSPLPTTPPPASAPACTADQLRGRSLGYPGISQDDGDVIDFRNVSPHTCLLTGQVHATLLGHGEAPLQVTGTGRYLPDRMASFDMAPGQSTQVWFFATSACERRPADGSAPVPVTTARIEIPGGGSVTVDGLNMPRECGISAKQFSQDLGEPTYPPAPLEGAKLFLEAPPTVRAGTSFDYVLMVVNPLDHPVPSPRVPRTTKD